MVLGHVTGKYTRSQKKLDTFVMRIVANLVNIPLKSNRFLIGKTPDCQMPQLLLIQIFANKSYARIRDFNETGYFFAHMITLTTADKIFGIPHP